MAKVLVVDDHALVRHALSHLVESRPDLELCGAATNTAGARRSLQEHQPDLVILDLCLEESRIEGLKLIEEIRSDYPNTTVLVSSMQDENVFAQRSLDAGAAGYVSKSESVSTLSNAISQVLRGETYRSDRSNKNVIPHSAHTPAPRSGNRLEQLSPRELEIFELVGQGKSPHEIAKQLDIGLKTVDAHRQNIRRKLGLANMGDVIRQATIWTASSN